MPTDNVELTKYYERLLALEADFLQAAKMIFADGGPWPNDHSKDCRCCIRCRYTAALQQCTANSDAIYDSFIGRLLIGSSGQNCRRMRLHRPFMVRGYREPEKYGNSTTVCVNAAVGVLEALRKLDQSKAPYMAVCRLDFVTALSLMDISTYFDL